jgi:predicted Rdx family selenoprotein
MEHALCCITVPLVRALHRLLIRDSTDERLYRLHRATWTSTELFLTFPSPALRSITLIPLNAEDTTGRFRVWLATGEGLRPVLVWDRKVEGKFPELKELVRGYLWFLFKFKAVRFCRNSASVTIYSQGSRWVIPISDGSSFAALATYQM